MVRHRGSLSDPFVAFFLRSLLWLVRLLRFPRALGQHTAPKRRIETDVMKMYVLSTLTPGSQAERACHSTL